MKTIYLDIMLGGYFYCQLKYQFCPAFVLTVEQLQDFVEQKRPTLHGKKYQICPTLQRA